MQPFEDFPADFVSSERSRILECVKHTRGEGTERKVSTKYVLVLIDLQLRRGGREGGGGGAERLLEGRCQRFNRDVKPAS